MRVFSSPFCFASSASLISSKVLQTQKSYNYGLPVYMGSPSGSLYAALIAAILLLFGGSSFGCGQAGCELLRLFWGFGDSERVVFCRSVSDCGDHSKNLG